MKFISNILKAFLFNLCFIGIIYSSESCPSISPRMAGESPSEQVEAIINDVVCSFIELKSSGNSGLSSTLNLTKKKILPYIDLEYSTQLALSKYWEQLEPREKKIFERDIKNSLIDDYVEILSDLTDWEDINVAVSHDYKQTENIARVKVSASLGNDSSNAAVTLKLIFKNRWKIYDLEYQSISIIDMEKMGYDSKIKRQGIKPLVQKLLNKS